jgi:hypothetical protein
LQTGGAALAGAARLGGTLAHVREGMRIPSDLAIGELAPQLEAHRTVLYSSCQNLSDPGTEEYT